MTRAIVMAAACALLACGGDDDTSTDAGADTGVTGDGAVDGGGDGGVVAQSDIFDVWEELQQRIAQGGILFRVQVIGSRVQRQTPANPPPVTSGEV